MNEKSKRRGGLEEEPVIIFTGQYCPKNHGAGGWAAVIRKGAKKRIVGGALPSATQPRLELLATISALQDLAQPLPVILCSGSQAVIDGMTQGCHEWAKNGGKTAAGKAVPNADLWVLLGAAAGRHHSVSWCWVPKHSKGADPRKAEADKRAKGEVENLSKGANAGVPEKETAEDFGFGELPPSAP